MWAGNSGTQPAAGNGTCGSGTLSNSLSGAAYSNSFVYTHLGQLWQGPLNGGSTPYQYLYCNSSHPHQLDGLYPTGTTCSNKSGQVYTSSYDNWGNITSRFYSGTTATLSYDKLDHFVMWDVGSTNREWYVYDSGGSRGLRRSTNSSSTTLTVYAFGLEEHVYSSSGTNQSNTYYYTPGGQLIGELNGSATQFLLTDALGSVLASVSNVAGSAAVQGTSYTYDAEMGRMTAETIHLDGSKSRSEVKPGSDEYEQALQAIDAQNASSLSFLIRDRGQPKDLTRGGILVRPPGKGDGGRP